MSISKNAPWFIFFTLMFVSLAFIGYRLDVNIWLILIISFFVFFLHLSRAKAVMQLQAASCSRQEMLATAMIFLVIVTSVMSVFKYGYVLPAHDPIAVPLLSKHVNEGFLSLEIFPAGSSAYSYPPGYPLIFSPLWSFLSAPNVYFVFKIFNLLIVSLIPVSWAWMAQRLFIKDIPFPLVVGAGYLAFYGFERTLGFALPFAGKNAVLFGIFLAPIIFVGLIRLSSEKRVWPLAILPFFGLVLIHYSMLHLIAALVGGYVIASLLFKEINFSEISRLALVGLSVFVLLIVFLSEALFDPRSAGLVWNPISGFASLFDMLRSEKQAIVIFMDADFGLLGSPYRGLVLAALTIFSLSIGISMRDSGLTKAAAFCILSVFLSLIMAFGIVPSGLSIDFGRWFLWSLQAMVFLVFFIAVYKVQKGSKLFLKILFSIIVFSMFFFGVFQAVKDFTTYKSVNKAQAVSYQELTSMMNAVEEATRGSKCSIISDSKAFPERLIVVQSSKVWEYAESATACKFLNGSWMQPGLVGAREIGGLPSMKVLETALTEDSVIFVGGLKKLKDYLSIMSRKGLNVDADSLGVVGGVSVFRLRLNE